VPRLLTPPIAWQELQKFGSESLLNFNVDIRLVSIAPSATWANVLLRQELPDLFNCRNDEGKELLHIQVSHANSEDKEKKLLNSEGGASS
jgi:hypothetical protein